MRRRTRRRTRLLVFVGATALSATARAADPPPAQKEADALFAEGRELLEKGRYVDACPKLKRSAELSAAVGTLTNLGYCWEQLGRLRSAMDAYGEAEVLASATGDPKRAAFARERLTAIESRAPKLVIRLAPPATADIEITRNGATVPRSELDHPVPVDPEDYVIAASAPGHETWRGAIMVRGDGATVTVIVPPLASARSVALPPPSPIGARRIAALTLGGAALVTLGAGLATALSAKARYDDAAPHCDDRGCDEIGASLQGRAVVQGNVATALVGFGIASAAAGIYLWIVGAPELRVQPGRAKARVDVSPLGIGGTF
ncbi:MAG: hypothetical protein KF819_24375 [Labilithrix sp.]|nr:hypothetical protein [Labilithrix sp.]